MLHEGTLFIVATPIGNIDDMTPRGRRILAEVDLIAAEDTRRAGLLMSRLGLPKKPLVSYYDAIEDRRAGEIIARIKNEKLQVAVISDAGTPCISDPGYRIVALAQKEGIAVHPIPGASALTTLVSASGLPSSRIFFVGFLPNKQNSILSEFHSWKGLRASIVFYESARRLEKSLTLLHEIAPNVSLTIGRELTKLHEEIVQLSLSDAIDWAKSHDSLRGEVAVIVDMTAIEPTEGGMSIEQLKDEIRAALRTGSTFKELLARFRDKGLSRSELYQELVKAKKEFDADES